MTGTNVQKNDVLFIPGIPENSVHNSDKSSKNRSGLKAKGIKK